jgi:hypothetical protein
LHAFSSTPQSGITTLIFPRNNKKDWDELPAFITEGMTAHFVEWYDEVFEVAFAPEVVKRAREARAVTRAAAISEFESEKKERAAAAAAPAVVELSQKPADSEAKKSGDSAADESKPKRKPTFLVTPRWATVGTPPAALEQEWADLGADSPFTIPASPAAAAPGSSAPAPAAPVAARSRDL